MQKTKNRWPNGALPLMETIGPTSTKAKNLPQTNASESLLSMKQSRLIVNSGMGMFPTETEDKNDKVKLSS